MSCVTAATDYNCAYNRVYFKLDVFVFEMKGKEKKSIYIAPLYSV